MEAMHWVVMVAGVVVYALGVALFRRQALAHYATLDAVALVPSRADRHAALVCGLMWPVWVVVLAAAITWEWATGERAFLALLAAFVGLATGCVHDVARHVQGDRVIEVAHTSVLRRGCHEVALQDGDVRMALVAKDLSASSELAAAGVVGAAAVAGPIGAGVAAVGAALDQALGSRRTNDSCEPRDLARDVVAAGAGAARARVVDEEGELVVEEEE